MQGDDITRDDLMNIIKIVRTNIGEDQDIDGNTFLEEQYMNDLVLVQNFIVKKLEAQKLKNISENGVSIHSRQDFPTLVIYIF